MGLMDIFKPREKRSLDAVGFDPRFAPDAWSRARTTYSISATAVMSNSAVAARCIAIRAEISALTPLNLYRTRPDGTTEVVTDNPLQSVLNVAANPKMSAFEFREFLSRSLDYHGEAFALIERDSAGQVAALWPIIATSVSVQRAPSGNLVFNYTLPDMRAGTALQDEMLFIRNASDDTLRGVSPIRRAAAALGLQIAYADTAAKYVADGMRPGVIINVPGNFKPGKTDEVKAARVPLDKSGVAIFQGGEKVTPITFTPVDAQILESRQFGNKEVAFAFSIPVGYLGLQDTASYGSATQSAADLVASAIHPLSVRIEQAMTLCLLTPTQRRTLSIAHDLGGLLRSDDAARWQSYKTAREIGAMAAEEIRAAENLGPKNPAFDYAPLRVSAARTDPIASIK